MHEIIVNLHIHTCYSDGSLPHKDIALIACNAGLDALITTDHNILVKDAQRYYQFGEKKVLLLVGEEIHDQARQPQKSHLLVFGIKQDLAAFAFDPQVLINKVNQAGGISFLAHPFDPALTIFGEPNISWDDWEVGGFTGIELWNGMSELKIHSHNKWEAVFYAMFPAFLALQPPAQILAIWNQLLKKGGKVVAIGGSDSHASHYHMGPLSKTVFPYEFHFRAINTHVLLPENLSGDEVVDSQAILTGLKNGHAFIGYDLISSTRGFQFYLSTPAQKTEMGDEVRFTAKNQISIHLPGNARCLLLRNSEVISTWNNQKDIDYEISEPGIYRVECYRHFLGKLRGWIFSNPIYIQE